MQRITIRNVLSDLEHVEAPPTPDLKIQDVLYKAKSLLYRLSLHKPNMVHIFFFCIDPTFKLLHRRLVLLICNERLEPRSTYQCLQLSSDGCFVCQRVFLCSFLFWYRIREWIKDEVRIWKLKRRNKEKNLFGFVQKISKRNS